MMNDNQLVEIDEADIDVAEARYWIEFGAWCAVVMAPIIWWLQGPSVSTDQFVVRTGLIVISIVVGLGMRIWAIVCPISPTQAANSVAQPPPPCSASSSAEGPLP